MALETDSEAASPADGAFGALMRAERMQGGLLADLTGDITLSVPTLAEMAAGGSESTQELLSGGVAPEMMLQVVSFGSSRASERLFFQHVERRWELHRDYRQVSS